MKPLTQQTQLEKRQWVQYYLRMRYPNANDNLRKAIIANTQERYVKGQVVDIEA